LSECRQEAVKRLWSLGMSPGEKLTKGTYLLGLKAAALAARHLAVQDS
jgi:hypothetical protein